MNFQLTDEQKELADGFMSKRQTPSPGGIGGRFTFCFTITSIGQVCILRDNLTKDEIDLTDYEAF